MSVEIVVSTDCVTIRQSALWRKELKEAHSALSVPVRDASGGGVVWLGGMVLTATIFIQNSDH